MFSELDLMHPLGFTPKASVFNPELNPDGQTLSRIKVDVAAATAVSAPILLKSRGVRSALPPNVRADVALRVWLA